MKKWEEIPAARAAAIIPEDLVQHFDDWRLIDPFAAALLAAKIRSANQGRSEPPEWINQIADIIERERKKLLSTAEADLRISQANAFQETQKSAG